MTYRARCKGRRVRDRHVQAMRERRQYTSWRRRLDAIQYAPVPDGLAGALHLEMVGSLLMFERSLQMHLYRPHGSMGWTTWEEKYREKYCGIPMASKTPYGGLRAWLP